MRNYPPITGISLADWSRRVEITRANYPLAFDGGARIEPDSRCRPLVPERVLRRHVDLTSIALAYLARPVSPMWPGVR